MSPEMQQRIREMYDNGLTAAEIARLLHIAQMDVIAVVAGLTTEMIKELREMRRGR